jgi:hypothetical protein
VILLACAYIHRLLTNTYTHLAGTFSPLKEIIICIQTRFAITESTVREIQKYDHTAIVTALCIFSNFRVFSAQLLSLTYNSYNSYDSHSGLEEPRGTRTVRNEPGVRDITTCSVTP